MSNILQKIGFERIAIASLVISLATSLVSICGIVYFSKTLERIDVTNQSKMISVDTKLQDIDRKLAVLPKKPVVSSVKVADRTEILALLEKTIPTIEDSITVRRRPGGTGFEFTFILKNTSGVALNCTTPQVEMTVDSYPSSETNPTLVAEAGAA